MGLRPTKVMKTPIGRDREERVHLTGSAPAPLLAKARVTVAARMGLRSSKVLRASSTEPCAQSRYRSVEDAVRERWVRN